MKAKFLIIIFSLFLTTTVWGYNNPSAGLAFLKINPDSRLTALGGAGVALRANEFPASLLLNPALGAGSSTTIAQLGHSFWYANSGIEFLGIGFPLAQWHWGVLLTSANISGFEYRDTRATDKPIDTFGAHYLNAGINAAKALSSKTSVGVQLNFLYEKLFYEMANGASVSAGIRYRWNRYLSLGAALNNVGAMTKLRSESTPLPTAFRVGGAFSHPLSSTLTYQLLLDAGYYLGDYGFIASGVEVNFQSMLTLRAGVQADADQVQPAMGFGIHWQQFYLNYGLILSGNSLGLPQQLNFSIQL